MTYRLRLVDPNEEPPKRPVNWGCLAAVVFCVVFWCFVIWLLVN